MWTKKIDENLHWILSWHLAVSHCNETKKEKLLVTRDPSLNSHQTNSLSSKMTAVKIPIRKSRLIVTINTVTCWLLLQMKLDLPLDCDRPNPLIMVKCVELAVDNWSASLVAAGFVDDDIKWLCFMLKTRAPVNAAFVWWWWRRDECSWILAKLSKLATVRRREEALWGWSYYLRD